MPGPAPKAAARRQRPKRDMGADVGVINAPGNAPAMPQNLCGVAVDAWECYWRDVVSGVMRASDVGLALRWIKNVDRYHRLSAVADAEPIVSGSTGQQRANPLYDLVFKLEASIREDEKQLGIGPLSRLRLGTAVAESAKSLSDLNAEVESDDEDDDPRAILTVLST